MDITRNDHIRLFHFFAQHKDLFQQQDSAFDHAGEPNHDFISYRGFKPKDQHLFLDKQFDMIIIYWKSNY